MVGEWTGGAVGAGRGKIGLKSRGFGAFRLGQFPCERCYTDADDMRIPRPPLPRLTSPKLGNILEFVTCKRSGLETRKAIQARYLT